MSDIALGVLIESDQPRDAIHVAVIPVVAGERLRPGEHVALSEAGSNVAQSSDDGCVGIIDPFLRLPVAKGQRCWLLLYQNAVTGMRHHWAHPAFALENTPEASPLNDVAESVAWLKKAAERLGVQYTTLIDDWSPLVQDDYINNGECIRDIWCEIENDFWRHRKIVTGKDIAESDRGGFTCSC